LTDVSGGECLTTAGGWYWIGIAGAYGAWATGCKQVNSRGFEVFQLNRSGVWQDQNAQAMQISVSQNDGTPWIVGEDYTVSVRNSTGGWTNKTAGLPTSCPAGCQAQQVAAVNSTEAYVLSGQPTQGMGYYVYKYNGTKWAQIPNSDDIYIAVSGLVGSIFRNTYVIYSVDWFGNVYYWECSAGNSGC
jgi:hypothetical protein